MCVCSYSLETVGLPRWRYLYDAFLYLIVSGGCNTHGGSSTKLTETHGANSMFCVCFLSAVADTLYIRYWASRALWRTLSPCMLKHRIYYCIELKLQRTLNSMCNICSLLKASVFHHCGVMLTSRSNSLHRCVQSWCMMGRSSSHIRVGHPHVWCHQREACDMVCNGWSTSHLVVK